MVCWLRRPELPVGRLEDVFVKGTLYAKYANAQAKSTPGIPFKAAGADRSFSIAYEEISTLNGVKGNTGVF